MIRICHGSDVSEIYVYDEEAQPTGADGQYWWDYADRSMARFSPEPTWNVPSNRVLDQALQTVVITAYEQWMRASLDEFLLEETAYWKKRKASETKDKWLAHQKLEDLHATLKKSGASAFIQGWKELFPDGLCRLTSASVYWKTKEEKDEWSIPFSGQRLAGFLLQHTLPLQRRGSSNSLKCNVREITAVWPDADSNSIELWVATASSPIIFGKCRFEFESHVKHELVAIPLVQLIATVIDIADPELIDLIFDDQFKALILNIATVGADRNSRLGTFEGECCDMGPMPSLITFLSKVVSCIQKAIIYELQSDSSGNSNVISRLGVPCLVEIVNASLIGLKWDSSQALLLAEKYSRSTTRNEFVGLAVTRNNLHQFATSPTIGKKVLAGYSISLANRVRGHGPCFTEDVAFLRDIFGCAAVDSFGCEDIYGTIPEMAANLTSELAMLDQSGFDDFDFYYSLLSPLRAAGVHVENLAKTIHDSPSNREEAKSGADFSKYLDLQWLEPLVKELKRHISAQKRNGVKDMLNECIMKFSAANKLAGGSLKVIESISRD